MTIQFKDSWYCTNVPGIVGAVVGVDGKSRVIAYKAAGHFDRIETA